MEEEQTKMKIAVLSGKGGTGKTFLSVNLACTEGNSVYVDCDIEEPNGHLFFKPNWQNEKSINVSLPDFDMEACTGCRKCVDFCKFNALVYIKNKIFLFDEVCHSCGGCQILCPAEAVGEKEKEVGIVREGLSSDVKIISGMLNVGEMTGTPIIGQMMEDIKDEDKTVIIDCPPGSACIVMDSIKDADYCILVGEPTIFGSHNLAMVYELVKLMGKPFGVVLNKCLDGENPSEKFCQEKGIDIIGKIPFNSKIGKMNSDGEILSLASDEYRGYFEEILAKAKEAVR